MEREFPFDNDSYTDTYKAIITESMAIGKNGEDVLAIAFCPDDFEEFRDLDGNLRFPQGLDACECFFIDKKTFDRIREKLKFPLVSKD